MGSQQQFCLKWNNHQTNLLSIFEDLLENESLVDVTLACDGESLKAHKMVLSACSPYFQVLFRENPCKHPIIILRDTKFSDIKALVDFMYKGEVNVNENQLSEFLKTANVLKIKGLTEIKNLKTLEQKRALLETENVAASRSMQSSPTMKKRHRRGSGNKEQSDNSRDQIEDQLELPVAPLLTDSPFIVKQEILSDDDDEGESQITGICESSETRLTLEEFPGSVLGDSVSTRPRHRRRRTSRNSEHSAGDGQSEDSLSITDTPYIPLVVKPEVFNANVNLSEMDAIDTVSCLPSMDEDKNRNTRPVNYKNVENEVCMEIVSTASSSREKQRISRNTNSMTKRYKTLSLEEKVSLIKEVELKLCKKTTIALKYGIPKSTLSTIIKKRDTYLNAYKKFAPEQKRLKEDKLPTRVPVGRNLRPILPASRKILSAQAHSYK